MPLLLALVLGCGKPDPGDPPAWLLDHASVVPSATGLEGVLVRTFYAEGWEKKQSEDYALCTMLQDMTGVVVAPYEGCRRCNAMYTVELRELETDCTDAQLDGLTLDGLVAIGVGQLHPDIAADDPNGGESLGWYVSYDGEVALEHGYAWPDDLDLLDGVQPWSAGNGYTLWPAYAWQL